MYLYWYLQRKFENCQLFLLWMQNKALFHCILKWYTYFFSLDSFGYLSQFSIFSSKQGFYEDHHCVFNERSFLIEKIILFFVCFHNQFWTLSECQLIALGTQFQQSVAAPALWYHIKVLPSPYLCTNLDLIYTHEQNVQNKMFTLSHCWKLAFLAN